MDLTSWLFYHGPRALYFLHFRHNSFRQFVVVSNHSFWTKWHLRGCKVGRRGGGWLGKNLGWWDLTTSRSLWSCCLFSIQNCRYGEKTKLHNTGFTKYLIIKNKRQITPYFKYLKHVNHLPKLFKFCQNCQKKTQSHKPKNMFGQNSVTCGTNFTLAPEILNNHFSISSKSKLGALSKPGN